MTEKKEEELSKKLQSVKGKPLTMTNKVENANIKNWVKLIIFIDIIKIFSFRKSKNGFFLHFLKI